MSSHDPYRDGEISFTVDEVREIAKGVRAGDLSVSAELDRRADLMQASNNLLAQLRAERDERGW